MVEIKPFAIERYFALHEFSARYLLSSSDCEALSMEELLDSADTEAKQLWDTLRLGYTESSGHPLLRESISESYQHIDPEQVLVVVPEEGIFLLMQTLLSPDDHLISTFPGYQSLYEVAISIGCEVSRWEPDESMGWHFNIRQLEKMFRDNTRLVVVNFPHNPTGYVPSVENFRALATLARSRNCYLFSDEMYRHLEIDTPGSLPAGCEIYDKAVSLSGLSKTFGLPGLRIGWITTQDQGLLDRMRHLKDYTTICNSAPSEILALMAVRSREKIISRQCARIQKNLALLDNFMSAYEDCFIWQRPAGGSVCFPRLMTTDDSLEFCRKLIANTGIMLVPSRMFMYGDRHVRIGFGRKDFPEVVERFAGYLDQNYR